MIARAIVASLTGSPPAPSHSAQCSGSVASAFPVICDPRPAASAAPFTDGRPGIGLGASDPLSRRSRSYRLIVRTDTPNVSATTALPSPLSTAATTRSRSSIEYPAIPTSLTAGTRLVKGAVAVVCCLGKNDTWRVLPVSNYVGIHGISHHLTHH